jgi:hypothetical protein
MYGHKLHSCPSVETYGLHDVAFDALLQRLSDLSMKKIYRAACHHGADFEAIGAPCRHAWT